MRRKGYLCASHCFLYQYGFISRKKLRIPFTKLQTVVFFEKYHSQSQYYGWRLYVLR